MLWEKNTIQAIYEQPLFDLLFEAQRIHREHHPANTVEMAQLLSIKTGACPEDCNYCSQSGHHSTDLRKEKLLDKETVMNAAREAKNRGATRFCLGAAWRTPPEKAMPVVLEMIREVKALGMETCVTLGMLSKEQAEALKAAGLDYYNHNIDTSPSYYEKVVTTRKFQDRLDTLQTLRDSDIKVCCGGILGLGESREDRMEFLQTLANLSPPPESVPINQLIPVPGTPFANNAPIDGFEIVRTIASARILMPQSVIRLTAGRTAMNDALQALCFFAGANSIFIGDTLLTKANPELNQDQQLLEKLGIERAVTGVFGENA